MPPRRTALWYRSPQPRRPLFCVSDASTELVKRTDPLPLCSGDDIVTSSVTDHDAAQSARALRMWSLIGWNLAMSIQWGGDLRQVLSEQSVGAITIPRNVYRLPAPQRDRVIHNGCEGSSDIRLQ